MGSRDELIPKLVELNQKLVDLFDEALENRRIQVDSDYAKVCVLFLAKARKTHQAISLLARNGFGEDAVVLCRSLLNLAFNLHWISHEPEERVQAYIDYDVVLQARQLRKVIEDPNLVGGMTDEQLRDYRELLVELSTSEKNANHRHGYTWKGWSGKSIRDTANDSGMANDYDTFYSLASDIEHSNVASLLEYLVPGTEDEFAFSSSPSLNWVYESLHMALLTLVDIGKLIDADLQLRIKDQLVALDTEALGLVGARRLPDTS